MNIFLNNESIVVVPFLNEVPGYFVISGSNSNGVVLKATFPGTT